MPEDKTIDALKVRGKVAEISIEAKFLWKAKKSQEIRRNSLALLLHNTVDLSVTFKNGKKCTLTRTHLQ